MTLIPVQMVAGKQGPCALSFCGSGFMVVYHFGVAQCLLDLAPELIHKAPKVFGASSGSLAAAAVVCGINMEDICAEIMATASEIRQHLLGPLNPSFSLFRVLEISLRRNLPENAHQLASGRLFISVTRLDNRENRLLSKFSTKEELVQAILCSCFIPIYCGVVPPFFHGAWYIDGGLTNMLPVEAKEETITVSPFSGEIDICPQDDPETVNVMQICGFNFYLNMRNFIRMSDALFPPPSQVLRKMFFCGYQDALFFLQTNYLKISSSPVSFTQVCGRQIDQETMENSLPADKCKENIQSLRASQEEASQTCTEESPLSEYVKLNDGVSSEYTVQTSVDRLAPEEESYHVDRSSGCTEQKIAQSPLCADQTSEKPPTQHETNHETSLLHSENSSDSSVPGSDQDFDWNLEILEQAVYNSLPAWVQGALLFNLVGQEGIFGFLSSSLFLRLLSYCFLPYTLPLFLTYIFSQRILHWLVTRPEEVLLFCQGVKQTLIIIKDLAIKNVSRLFVESIWNQLFLSQPQFSSDSSKEDSLSSDLRYRSMLHVQLSGSSTSFLDLQFNLQVAMQENPGHLGVWPGDLPLEFEACDESHSPEVEESDLSLEETYDSHPSNSVVPAFDSI
ncbi:patatin-like phospholipase domain-containing protein 1 isoform X1 [Polypterus senegalus]|uniref:patatin-like phospholipase domain-containing protein 1 isoform X1 n=1 Tax=Polypterus senegalus TaxID=55291 RepID=UPI0019659A81|nr:patatin-like phospholipase domain-containing protein 1 isoform X1 [Polypterus senegalus]XP_039605263.1 patatin-like phospholipase domain-containing protein 1 isoform X1 [Polypterus senegalus]